MSCNSFNVIYVVICSGCLKEYIGDAGVSKTGLRDRVRVYKTAHKRTSASTIKS